jgi:DNA invertase Pin-like site-specific DNA recombinase
MKKVYGYIRVSTFKQGTGVSLQEQKDAIIRYAEKHNLDIIEWFEEQETAAKQGRPLFNMMIKQVKTGKASGVIIHKIDRSARNLKDWALLGDLIDEGIEIHFAHESLDLETRGGRLAADIQAVIASDYIRNLQEEAKKGLYGRLKQGIYPFHAPVGYRNNGRGKNKTIDPVMGPLVKRAFQLYATEKYNLRTLQRTMKELGLKNREGHSVNVNSLSLILNNPFYTGVMRVKAKSFPGGHEPLITSDLYFKVKDILRGKTNTKKLKNNFLFSRSVKCSNCNYSLIGEKVKGYIYYRCHTKICPTKCIREELIEKMLIKEIGSMRLHPHENEMLLKLLEETEVLSLNQSAGFESSIDLQLERASLKLERLTDAFVEGVIDKEQFNIKKEQVLIEIQSLKNHSSKISVDKQIIFRKAKYFLELIKSLKNIYFNAIPEEKRKILKLTTSNFSADRKKLTISMKSPYSELLNYANSSQCWDKRNIYLNCTAEFANPEISTVVPVDKDKLKEQMKQLLEIILGYFEKMVEDEKNNKEVEYSYDEEFNPGTKYNI